MEYKLFADGACTKNPGGEASYGYVLYGNDEKIDYGYGIIGSGAMMNNVIAEYYAIAQGIASFIRHWKDPRSSLIIYNDSKFVISQVLSHEILGFQLKNLKNFVDVKLEWIPREKNLADIFSKRLRTGLSKTYPD
jgi:RNase H-like protein